MENETNKPTPDPVPEAESAPAEEADDLILGPPAEEDEDPDEVSDETPTEVAVEDGETGDPAEAEASIKPDAEAVEPEKIETVTVVVDDESCEPDEPSAEPSDEGDLETPGEESQPEPEVDEDPMQELAQAQAAIAQRQEELNILFERRLGYDDARDTQIERLHEELQTHREGLLEKARLPVLRDLVSLSDDLKKMIAVWSEKPEAERDWDRFLKNLDTFPEEIVDILERYGMEPFVEEGDAFNPAKQRAIKVVPTDDAAMNRQIAERLRPGLTWNGSIFRNEEVAVYKHQDKDTSSKESE